MTAFILDASVTMSWAFREELTPFSERLLGDLAAGEALVPAIWPLEVANVLLVLGASRPHQSGGRCTLHGAPPRHAHPRPRSRRELRL